MNLGSYELLDYGDSAILIEFSKVVTDEAWSKVHWLAKALSREEIPGVTTIYPTYTTILMSFNCLSTDRDSLKKYITDYIGRADYPAEGAAAGARYRFPVVFGGEWGPDLPFVAEHLGVSEETVIQTFCADFRKILTFATFGGFLMEGPTFSKKIPRRKSPHTEALGGMVEVAGDKTAFIPVTTSTGWQIIGHCPIQVINLEKMPFVPYQPGDCIEFFPIREDEKAAYEKKTIDEMKVNS